MLSCIWQSLGWECANRDRSTPVTVEDDDDDENEESEDDRPRVLASQRITGLGIAGSSPGNPIILRYVQPHLTTKRGREGLLESYPSLTGLPMRDQSSFPLSRQHPRT